MTESPVTTGSTIYYQILIFITVNIWAFMIFEVAQYQLVTLFENPLGWISWGSLTFVTLMPIAGLFAWQLKDQVKFHPVTWSYRIREVNETEYRQMISDYNRNYQYVIASFDIRLACIGASCYLGAIFLPFPLMRTDFVIISFVPLFVAIMLVIFGLFFSYLIFKLIPNSATPEFPHHDAHRLKRTVEFLSLLPGIFWSGVRLQIGESGGFYTLQNPQPIARVEGIESAARIECKINRNGQLQTMISVLESSDDEEPVPLETISEPITPIDATKLVKDTLLAYIKQHGGEEILQEVLEEVDRYIYSMSNP